MIEEHATVVGVEARLVWLETVRSSACGTCAARAGCGQPLMSKVLGGKAQQARNRLSVARPHSVPDLQIGDRVLLGIPESSVLVGTFWLYLAPILGLLTGAVLGQQLTGSDWAAAFMAVCLFAICLWGVGRQNKRWQNDDRWRPRILRRAGEVSTAAPARDGDRIAVKVL